MKIKKFNSLVKESIINKDSDIYNLFQEWVDDVENGSISIGYSRSDKIRYENKDQYSNKYDRYWVQFRGDNRNKSVSYEDSFNKKLISLIDSKLDLLSEYNIFMEGDTLSLVSKVEKYTKFDIDLFRRLNKAIKDIDVISSPIQNGYKADVSLAENPNKILEIIKSFDVVKEKFNVNYYNGSWIYIILK